MYSCVFFRILKFNLTIKKIIIKSIDSVKNEYSIGQSSRQVALVRNDKARRITLVRLDLSQLFIALEQLSQTPNAVVSRFAVLANHINVSQHLCHHPDQIASRYLRAAVAQVSNVNGHQNARNQRPMSFSAILEAWLKI